jgi:hypothetical protein
MDRTKAERKDRTRPAGDTGLRRAQKNATGLFLSQEAQFPPLAANLHEDGAL